jgi:hypothetical protein
VAAKQVFVSRAGVVVTWPVGEKLIRVNRPLMAIISPVVDGGFTTKSWFIEHIYRFMHILGQSYIKLNKGLEHAQFLRWTF